MLLSPSPPPPCGRCCFPPAFGVQLPSSSSLVVVLFPSSCWVVVLSHLRRSGAASLLFLGGGGGAFLPLSLSGGAIFPVVSLPLSLCVVLWCPLLPCFLRVVLLPPSSVWVVVLLRPFPHIYIIHIHNVQFTMDTNIEGGEGRPRRPKKAASPLLWAGVAFALFFFRSGGAFSTSLLWVWCCFPPLGGAASNPHFWCFPPLLPRGGAAFTSWVVAAFPLPFFGVVLVTKTNKPQKHTTNETNPKKKNEPKTNTKTLITSNSKNMLLQWYW